MAGAPWGAIIGNTLKGISEYIAVGGKPGLTNLDEVNFNKVYSDSISDAKAAMPGLMKASDSTSAFNTKNLNNILNLISPGLASTGQQIAQSFARNSADMIAGEVPGTINRQMGTNLRPRDLGMTSYQMTGAALQGVNNWLGSFTKAATPQQFDASNLLISAGARAGYLSSYEAQKAAVDTYNKKVRSAPDAINQFGAQIMSSIGGTIAGSGGGGGGGGGGGMDMGSIMSMMG